MREQQVTHMRSQMLPRWLSIDSFSPYSGNKSDRSMNLVLRHFAPRRWMCRTSSRLSHKSTKSLGHQTLCSHSNSRIAVSSHEALWCFILSRTPRYSSGRRWGGQTSSFSRSAHIPFRGPTSCCGTPWSESWLSRGQTLALSNGNL
jgi:hypothetical protein